jgi:thiol-disulfide isomerase/thioredoxin
MLEISMGNGKLKLPATRLIIMAAVAGVIAGGVAVYVSGGYSGNNPGTVAARGDGDAACAGKAEAAKAIAATATGDVAAMLPADPPQSLLALAFDGPDGKPMTLADRAGKTLLVNLWATWCAPCRAEMPALDALQAAKGGGDFEVVAINVDTGDDAKPKKFLADTGVKMLSYYRDASMGAFNMLKERGLALGLPVTLLVDTQGCLVAAMNGPADWSGPDAARLVDSALGRK